MARVRSVLANNRLSDGDGASGGIAVEFAGEHHVIESSRRQILNLLLSTYETAVNTNLELLRAHDQLKAMQAQLIEAEKLQATGRLAAGVAHEVRNPLAILEMGLQCIAESASGGESDPIVAEMRGAVQRANVVVTSLMEMATPSSLGMGEADLHRVIDGALEVLAAELERAGVNVVRSFAPDLPPLHLDADRIGQLFINLISNALQAMPDGGTLTIASRSETVDAAEAAFEAGLRSGSRFRAGERVVVVEVGDTGPGIAPEHLDKVFEPFFSTRPTGQGMGLGLTVARKLIELHRGSIRLQNRLEGGAVATLSFKIP
jgi:signal transduction histidine kinase